MMSNGGLLRFGAIAILTAGLLCPAVSQTWVKKISGAGLGNSLIYNTNNMNVLYGSPGSTRVYVSRNGGYSWQSYGIQMPDGGQIKALAVNPADTLHMLAGVEMGGGVFDRIYKTTNGGQNWTATWSGTFSYYGQPLEFEPVHPDTVYAMGSDTLWRSVDFGSTWNVVTIVSGFNTWCDAELRPDSGNVMYIGDNASGIWKTTNYGANWKQVYSTSGEIPSIAVDPFNPRIAYATKYSGGGGVIKTSDWGETWQSLSTPVGNGNTWWIICSPVNPGYVYFGTYIGMTAATGIYLSKNEGASWTNLIDSTMRAQAPLNYGLLATDTLTVIALQGNGIWKYQPAPQLAIVSPNGGETFEPGSSHNVTWTSAYLEYLRLEYSTNTGTTWVEISDSVPALPGSYLWTIPNTSSEQCLFRISDALFTTTRDTSDGVFTIYDSTMLVIEPNGGEVWSVGSNHAIRWIAGGPPMVNLDFSTDNGISWTFITKMSADAEIFDWPIPNTPSATCKVRVMNPSDSTHADTSDNVFSIVRVSFFTTSLVVEAGGVSSDTLRFGAIGGATDTVDTALGEIGLPAPPFPDSFDVRWRIEGTDGTRFNFQDTLSPGNTENRYIACFQAGMAGYPVTLQWDPDSLDYGYFVVRDTLTHGELLNVAMKNDSSCTISDTAIHAVEIIQHGGVTVTLASEGGWNLISLPMDLVDRGVGGIFPYITSAGFAYQGGYVPVSTFEYGEGYWIKAEQTTITGLPRDVDTVDLDVRWNMIGSVSEPVPVSSIVTEPESVIVSSFYGYLPSTSYQVAATIEPGRGYWVKTKEPGIMILSTSPVTSPKTTSPLDGLVSLNTLTISDSRGHSQTLYFGLNNGQIPDEFYESPPPPPNIGFYARFGNGTLVATHTVNQRKATEIPVSFQSAFFPIFFSWTVDNDEDFTYILKEKLGEVVVRETYLEPSGTMRWLGEVGTHVYLVIQRGSRDERRPDVFTLSESYPNPFNPITHLSFSLPTNAFVTINIYSVLGQHIRTLVDNVYGPGVFHVVWDGGTDGGDAAASGMYYIRMSARTIHALDGAGSYTRTTRVVLLR